MPATATVAHHVPGRIRIKIGGAENNSRLLSDIKQSLLPLDGVQGGEVHPLTSSLFVHYRRKDPKEFEEALRHHGKRSGTFNLAPPELGEAGEMYKEISHEAAVVPWRDRKS